MKNQTVHLCIVVLISVLLNLSTFSDSVSNPVWPPPPDKTRIEFIGEIFLKDLSPGMGFFSKLKNFVGGKAEEDQLIYPYDVLVLNGTMFLTCQGIPYLIEIDLKSKDFKKHTNKKYPFVFPVCLSQGEDNSILISDSQNGIVYKFSDNKVTPFISKGLTRPTGLTYLKKEKKLIIVDTGEHNFKIYNNDGKLIKVIPELKSDQTNFNFPTFVTTANNGNILINDALNYKIKRFDSDGNFISAFGSEGDSPGSFTRPKGIATDSENNIYVVDNLFDNLQILDSNGRVLLVIGQAGQLKGQFWSPSGIAILDDTVYIADTYNNRIQILHFLGGPE